MISRHSGRLAGMCEAGSAGWQDRIDPWGLASPMLYCSEYRWLTRYRGRTRVTTTARVSKLHSTP